MNLRADQIQFIRNIVTHFKNNGILELSQLAQPPFTDINDHGIFGLFEDEDRIIRIVEQVNNNAVGYNNLDIVCFFKNITIFVL